MKLSSDGVNTSAAFIAMIMMNRWRKDSRGF